jgi:40-residue YVTN family beta-propeller repeat
MLNKIEAGEYLIVLNKDEDSISLVSLNMSKVIKTISSDHNPHEVVVTPDGKKTYVTCSLGNTIDVIDNSNFEIINRIVDKDFDFPHGLGINKEGVLYVASTYSSKVFFIDTATDQIVNCIDTGEVHSHMVALTPDEKTIYVPNIGSDNISILSADTQFITGVIPVGKGPEGVAVHPEGKWLYVANQHENNLFIMDTTQHEILWKRKIGSCPIRIVFSPDGKYALIPNRESDDLTVILTAQEIAGFTRPWEIKRIPVGKWPGGTVFSNNGLMAYVANNKTNDLSIIDMALLKEVGRIDVGIHPDGIALLTVL